MDDLTAAIREQDVRDHELLSNTLLSSSAEIDASREKPIAPLARPDDGSSTKTNSAKVEAGLPDGGLKAWFQVAGSFLLLFNTW